MENVRSFASFFPGLLAFGLDRRGKAVNMERAQPDENFHSGFDVFHLLKLSTNRFIRVYMANTLGFHAFPELGGSVRMF